MAGLPFGARGTGCAGVNGVAALVLATACLHAGWNTAAKSLGDRWVSSALIGSVYTVAGLVAVIVLPAPDTASWLFIAGSVALQVGYLLLLTSAYQYGDMSRLYPLMRGMSPLLVTVFAVVVLREHVRVGVVAGVAVLVGGLVALAFAHGRPRRGHGVGLALATGVTIAAYTIVDGIGVRQSGHPLGYAAWLFALQGPILVAICLWRGGPGMAQRLWRHRVLGLAGGGLSLLSYGVVVWAQARAPLAIVAALRETSVLWGAVAGSVFLRERLDWKGVVATVLAAAGAVLVQVAS
jgi:drug/metabolite transporter (DMT)-like permease